jgi:hypothetical protein
MSFDWKHLIAAAVGLVLGVLGAQFGIDFSKSCPAVPPAAVAK